MIDRKDKFYPNEQRVIVDINIQVTNGNRHLSVTAERSDSDKKSIPTLEKPPLEAHTFEQ